MNKSKVFGLSLPSRNDSTDLADINVISNNFSLLDAKIPEKIEYARKKVINETRNEVYGAISYFEGEYNNILKNVEEDSTTDFPVTFPYKKIGLYYNEALKSFLSDANSNCYIIEVTPGERFNISNFVYGGTPAYILGGDFTTLKTLGSSATNNLFGGLEAMPENAKYLILHTTGDAETPCITRVSEQIITINDISVSNASKFIAEQKRSTTHLLYDGEVGATLMSRYVSDTFDGIYRYMFASGVYPLEAGKEYVICYNDSEIPQYAFCGFVCSENFTILNRIVKEDLNAHAMYTFTATENDKYIVLNCFDFNGNLQLGESKATSISKLVKIGNATFDGKNNITLGEIGGIDKSLNDKSWVSYGDSITWGVGVDYANGKKRWQDYVIERYSVGTHTNMGIGSTSIGYKDNIDVAKYPPLCNDDRLNGLIAESPDIVTILGGANDLSYDIPIGTDEDVENKNTSTFKGAYAYIIDKILTAKPDTVILLMGMFYCMVFTGTTHTIKEYAQATKEIAEYFGLPFIDLNECGFNKYNFNTTDGVFSTDGIHPNAEGVKRIAMVVSKWFDSFRGTVFDKNI